MGILICDEDQPVAAGWNVTEGVRRVSRAVA